MAQKNYTFQHGMFTTLFFIFILSILTLSSCTKNELTPNVASYSSKVKIYPKDQVKLLYALLSPEEKLAEWVGHIKYGITQINATPVQQAFVGEMLKNLDITYFNKPSRDIEIKLFTLESRLKAIFPEKKNLTYLFAGLENNYALFSAHYMEDSFEQETPKCSCSKKSDRCPGVMSCQAEVVCITSNGGCGLLWVYDCNSICQ